MSTNTLENIIKEGLTPIGVQKNGEAFGLSAEERPGILNLFGHSGQGKSIALEIIAIADICNGKGGMLIEPHGDLIKDIQAYVPADKADKVTIFEAQPGTLEENIAKFQKEIDLDEMKNDKQQYLLCKINYATLGTDLTRDFGTYVVKQFLQIVGGEDRSLVLDEAHNFVDKETLELILKSKEMRLSCVLSDQTCNQYNVDILERLFKASDHILCYFVDKEIADIISKYNVGMNSNDITALEKYNFIAKINAKTASPTVIQLKGVYPIPYPNNNL